MLSEADRLERIRNYLYPGDISEAVSLWEEFVRRPDRELWRDYDDLWHHNDSLYLSWYCCGNPLESRLLLETVVQAMSLRGAREFQKIIDKLDAFWTPPSPWPAVLGR
ncbi:hypothetical protein ACFU99_16945 [Streptomyces sp. NPDC057654]|uniref:hypothetical protein n=1 Tax=Streptomyces sp. NPDC057654 TaxID=3346196 RepID=UPI0036A446EA